MRQTIRKSQLRKLVESVINEVTSTLDPNRAELNDTKMPLLKYLHYANAEEYDEDVVVDGYEPIAIVGGNISLTSDGWNRFGAALKDATIDADGIIETGSEQNDKIVNLFLHASAGYCSATNYDKWFEGPDAKLL